MIFQVAKFRRNTFNRASCPHRVMSASSKPEKKPPLIFIVDDNPDLTEMAEMVLLGEGYRCARFGDPQEVLQSFQQNAERPDLLLTDYEMGSMNGLELIEHCRRDVPGLKAVLLSGTVEASTALRHPVRINHFLSKPYQPRDLMALVKSLLAE